MKACRTHYPEIVELLLKHADSKGIEVPEPDDFIFNWGGHVFNAIEQPTIDLLEKYKKRKKGQNKM